MITEFVVTPGEQPKRLDMFIVNRERQSDLERLRHLVEDGVVKPTVDTVYPLDQAAEAVQHLVAGHTKGKLAVAVNDPSAAD